jgi:DNA-binding GntR family transcriptional regulator
MPITLTVDRANLDRQSATAIRHAIVSGALTPGSFLKESELAEELGLSRSTTRTALKLLEIEGLVSQQPYSGGWKIFSLSADDALHLYAIRGRLEGLAASAVAEAGRPQSMTAIEAAYAAMTAAGRDGDMQNMSRADHAFHMQVIIEAGNPRLRDQYSSLQQHIQIYVAAANRIRSRFTDIVHDHDDMKRFIIEGDAQQADLAARDHSRRAGLMIARTLSSTVA